MSNKKIYVLFIVLFILLVGLSVTAATEQNSTETTVKDSSTTKAPGSSDKDYAYNVTGNDPVKSDVNQLVKSGSKSISKSSNVQSKGDDLLDFSLYTSDIECVYGDMVNIDVTTTPTVNEGVLSFFINGRLVGVKNLSNAQPSYTLRTANYVPGTYTIMVSYSSSMIYINNQTEATIKINKLNTTINNLQYEFNNNNNINVLMNIMDSKNNPVDIGYVNVYNNTNKIANIEIEEENIRFTLPGVYNTETLLFEFEGDEYLNATNITETISIPLKNLTVSSNNNITAYVGDIVSVPFSFNESVNDGKLSISYGGSPDNIIDVTGAVNSISFDTTGYLQGEYLLVLRYYDSHIFNTNTTSTTLYLYQPSSIIADKDNVNVILGKGNEYVVNFETGLDQWDDVIWGSIDVYIDNKIIGTLIIDDITGNTSSITLDDYNLEDLTPGTHTLTSIFNTDDNYIETSRTTVILNVGGDVELILPENITVMTSDSIVIPVNATFNNQRLNVGNLTFYIDDVQVGTLDLSTGRNNITVSNSYNPGIYNIRVNYTDNNGIYTNTSNTTTLYVRSTTSIITGVLNDTIRNTTFTVSLRDARGNNFDGLVNITLSSGTTRENVQVTNGIATLTLDDLTVGSNTFTITYPGNTIYDASTTTLTISVVKLNSTTQMPKKNLQNTNGT